MFNETKTEFHIVCDELRKHVTLSDLVDYYGVGQVEAQEMLDDISALFVYSETPVNDAYDLLSFCKSVYYSNKLRDAMVDCVKSQTIHTPSGEWTIEQKGKQTIMR